jgi:hypothetical protein
LTHFALRRLAHFGLDLQRYEDLFQTALCAVLRGIDGEAGEGRTPNQRDLESANTFKNYIRGVINSIAEGWARTHHTQRQWDHCSLELVQETLAAPQESQIEFRDIKRELFTRLRQRASTRLLPTIDAWEESPDGRIPCVTSRKHVCAVKRLAQHIARELDFTPANRKPPGRGPSGLSNLASAQKAQPKDN